MAKRAGSLLFFGLALCLSACGWIGGDGEGRPAELEATQWVFREEVDPLTDDQLSIAGKLIRSGPYAFEVEFSCRNGRLGSYRLTALDALGDPVPLHVEPDYLTGADSASATVRADLLPARTSDYVLDRFGNVFIFSATNMGREGMAELLNARNLTMGFKLADGDAIVEVDQANSAIQRALRPCARFAQRPASADPKPAVPAVAASAEEPTEPAAPAPAPPPVPAAGPATTARPAPARLPARPTASRREEPARPVRSAVVPPVRTASAPPRTAEARRPTVPAPARIAAAGQGESQSQRQALGQGPSFSCADGLTRVERMICNDAELARLDRRMAALYEQARVSRASRASRAVRERVLRDQRLFLADVGQCRNTSCVSSGYRARIVELANY